MDYSSLHISDEDKREEQSVLNEIIKCIDASKSFVFDAGAGAGKTYALVQSLKYISVHFGEELKRHKQKALCITFTNVAAKEIIERLGNSNLIEVSTIHNCVWDIISPHQKQLVEIHMYKLKSEVAKIESNLTQEKWAERYIELSEQDKSLLLELMIAKKDIYYKYKSSAAANFKAEFALITKQFPDMLKNVANFKKIVDNILKLNSYNVSIEKILAKDSKFKKVKYDARFNSDKLASMMISHDTLLEYTEKIVQDNLILRQMIFDKYPFILVDEYQDTDAKVISTLSRIEEYSKTVNHHCTIGYYGDKKQNIYEKGVGDSFSRHHTGLSRIKKEFNRRSANEVIDVANKIRNDDLHQKTIYSDFPKGSVNFYNAEISRNQFIEAHIKMWNITAENKLHCFELTNERVAEFSGFSSIYNFFKNSAWYKVGKRYEFLREHILSLDTTKLGIVQSLIFRILDFKYKIQIDSTMIIDVTVFGKKDNALNVLHLRELIEKLKSKNGDTLREYLCSLFTSYKSGDNNYDKCIEHIIGEKISSIEEFELFVLDKLYLSDIDDSAVDEKFAEYRQEIDVFLKLDMSIFDLWYKYIIDKSEGNIIYHTYHGTKGREFENVVIFMNSKFGRDDLYFNRLFEVISEKNENETEKISEARNLLYVAVTRAVKNLSILYFDSLNGSHEQIVSVFGEIKNTIS